MFYGNFRSVEISSWLVLPGLKFLKVVTGLIKTLHYVHVVVLLGDVFLKYNSQGNCGENDRS